MTDTEFHPDLRRAARVLPRALVTRRSLPVSRALMRMQGLRPNPKGVQTVAINGTTSVRLYRPDGVTDPAPALLWIHGGGYVIGNARQDDQLCLRFADKLGIFVASVEYRLAPQHPYPASLEDCYAALAWLSRQPRVQSEKVAIGGASAGGGLAAALALLARDRGDIPVCFQLLVYPMVDDRSGYRPELDSRRHRLWNQRANQFGWSAYLGDADPDVAVPSRAADLSGLPPAWIGVGTLDLFHAEDLEYAERLRAAGVPCEVHEVPGAFHGFDLLLAKAGVSRAFADTQAEALGAALRT